MSTPDTVMLSILITLTLVTILLSIVFTTGMFSWHVEKRIIKKGETINWDLVDIHYSRTRLLCDAYGVDKPVKDFRGPLQAQKYIKKELKKAMKKHNVSQSVKTFSLAVIKMRGSHVNLDSSYDYSYGAHNKSVGHVSLNLEQIAIISSKGINANNAYDLILKGLTFEQILEVENMPAEWALKLFAPTSV